MNDLSDTLARLVPKARRDHLKQARAYAAPAVKFANRNPVLLISAGVIAVLGVVAFANRRKIAATAQPLIQDAKAKAQPLIEDVKARGQAMLETASTKSQELVEEAKSRGEAVIDKVRGRTPTTPAFGPTDVH